MKDLENKAGFTEGCMYNYKEIQALEQRVKELEDELKQLKEKTKFL